MVAQLVRHQQRRQRLRQPRHVLGDVDQRHREIARRVQHRQPERAGEHDVAGGGLAVLPQHDRPGEQAERQHDRDHGMQDAQLLEIEQAAPARVHLAVDGRVEAAMLAAEAAEGAHQRHVADDVDHLAVDRGGLVGEVVMQRPPGGGEAEHDEHHDAGDSRQEPAAIGRLMVQTSAIAATVAAQGGSTFQTNMFSTVNTAFEVAVTRLVSMPGRRSAK